MEIEAKTYTLELEEYEGVGSDKTVCFDRVLKSVYVGPIKAALNDSGPLFARRDENYITIRGSLP